MFVSYLSLGCAKLPDYGAIFLWLFSPPAHIHVNIVYFILPIFLLVI